MLGRRSVLLALGALCAFSLAFGCLAYRATGQEAKTHLGFDRNQYPDDDAMKLLRKDFVFTGYWLSPPPGEKTNTWQGKREYLRSLGYGFLLLVNGRDSRELKSTSDAAGKGTADAKAAAASAQREQFAPGATIFLDIEEGGRLPESYHSYLAAWAEELRKNGFVAGAYCSGMPVAEGGGVVITTAADIHFDVLLSGISLWIYDDSCPPSTGCTAGRPQAPSRDIAYAVVWQFAQSPRRKQYTARCKAKYAADGNCYAPSDVARKWFLDLNSATSPDPSGGAK